MKLSFIYDDEAWFWIFNDENCVWECWYEVGDAPATRLEKLDRDNVHYVVEIIGGMATAARHDENIYTYV